MERFQDNFGVLSSNLSHGRFNFVGSTLKAKTTK